MIIIQEKLIERSIFFQAFQCNVQVCKGACCWEGDFGAPLESEEIEILENEYRNIQPYLSEAGKNCIASKGTSTYYPKDKNVGTPLLENGACAYLVMDGGIASCGIENAYNAGATNFQKPISCHLYPIRIEKDQQTGFELLRYDQWDICKSACAKGEATQTKIFEFCKSALIRKYGEEFYEELVAANKNIILSGL